MISSLYGRVGAARDEPAHSYYCDASFGDAVMTFVSTAAALDADQIQAVDLVSKLYLLLLQL